MSTKAQAIWEEIKALPPEEQEQVHKDPEFDSLARNHQTPAVAAENRSARGGENVTRRS